MKIYDCFTFYNEFDLLEIRLEELFDHVDYFVISEANTTHSGKPKNFELLDNWSRVKNFEDKIIHIKVADMPGIKKEQRISPYTGQMEIWDNCWHNERFQRDALARGLRQGEPEDIMILSDVDELVRPQAVDQIRADMRHTLWAFKMPFFNYRFNYMWTEPLIYQVQGQAVRLNRASTEFKTCTNIREHYGANWANRPIDYDDGNEIALQHSGWHFSSLGSTKMVANKLENFAHNELAHQAATIDVDKLIAEGKTSINPNAKFEPVILDDYFPQTLLKNKEKYEHLILKDATQTVMSKLEKVMPYAH
jgi:beta-1,4-mannosyl-glycoprotein beta-1,4-N-acetylglucosaminyltransferase